MLVPDMLRKQDGLEDSQLRPQRQQQNLQCAHPDSSPVTDLLSEKVKFGEQAQLTVYLVLQPVHHIVTTGC